MVGTLILSSVFSLVISYYKNFTIFDTSIVSWVLLFLKYLVKFFFIKKSPNLFFLPIVSLVLLILLILNCNFQIMKHRCPLGTGTNEMNHDSFVFVFQINFLLNCAVRQC